MKAKELCRGAVQVVDQIVNMAVLTVIVLLLAFAGYALWDAEQIYQSAGSAQYAVYKPTAADGGKSFQELQAINQEVFSWLTVYGTNIDYPVTQGTDNLKYVNTNAEGLYSLAGAIFLDYLNNKNFTDFNHILYGHHMDKNAMFGEIDSFSDKHIFDTHRYGNLYFNKKNHGIEFFCFLHTDAYDNAVFAANINGDKRRQAYLGYLFAKAVHKRDIGVTTEDSIILLTTCSTDSTNGRDILVGRITDETFDDPFMKMNTTDKNGQVSADGQNSGTVKIPYWQILLMLLLAFPVLILVMKYKKGKKMKKR